MKDNITTIIAATILNIVEAIILMIYKYKMFYMFTMIDVYYNSQDL